VTYLLVVYLGINVCGILPGVSLLDFLEAKGSTCIVWTDRYFDRPVPMRSLSRCFDEAMEAASALRERLGRPVKAVCLNRFRPTSRRSFEED